MVPITWPLVPGTLHEPQDSTSLSQNLFWFLMVVKVDKLQLKPLMFTVSDLQLSVEYRNITDEESEAQITSAIC